MGDKRSTTYSPQKKFLEHFTHNKSNQACVFNVDKYVQ